MDEIPSHEILIIFRAGQCGNYIASNISRFILKEDTKAFKLETNEYIHIKGFQNFAKTHGNYHIITNVEPQHFNTLMKSKFDATDGSGLHQEYNIKKYRLMLQKIDAYKKVVVITNTWNETWTNILGGIKREISDRPDQLENRLTLFRKQWYNIDQDVNMHGEPTAKNYVFLSKQLKKKGMNVFDIDFKDLLIDKNVKTYSELCKFFGKTYVPIGYNELTLYVDKNIELMQKHGFFIQNV